MRTVVVTGGTRGIGAAIVDLFLANGDRVIVGARHQREIEDKSVFIPCDVTNPRHLRALAMNAGTVDVWVNNAGKSAWMPLDLIREDFVGEMLATNLSSVIFGSQAAVDSMRRGAIVNVSSVAGKRGSINNSVYCATKFGVNGVTQALAVELAPHIRVNAVCPVLVTTPGLMEAFESPHAPDFSKITTPMRRFPSPQEVAELVFFLSSEKASGITGQCLNVDCGLFPQ